MTPASGLDSILGVTMLRAVAATCALLILTLATAQGRLTVAIPEDPVTLDPAAASSTSALLVTNQVYDTLFELTPGGGIDGRLAAEWSYDGATRLLGWTADDMVGRSMSVIVPERLRVRHDAGYHRTMETGETRYGTSLLQVPAQHRDGHTVSVAFTVTLLWHPGQKAPYAIAAIMRDDTERWELARAAARAGRP